MIKIGNRQFGPTEGPWRHFAFGGGMSLVFMGNVLNQGTTFALMLLAAKLLPLAAFGKLALLSSLVAPVAFVISLGVGTTYIRDLHSASGRDLKGHFVALKFAVSIVTLLAGAALYLLSPLPESLNLTASALLANAGLLNLWVMIRNILQAEEDYLSLFLLMAYSSLTKIACAATLFFVTDASQYGLVFALYGSPALFALLVFMPSYRGALTGLDRAGFRRLLSYGRWVLGSGFVYMMIFRAPGISLDRLGLETELGYLGMATVMMGVYGLFSDAIKVVFLPKISRIGDMARYRTFVGQWRWGAVRAIPVLVAVLVGVLGFQWLIGVPKQGIVSFAMIGVGLSVSLIVGIYTTLIHSLGRPRAEFAFNVLRLSLLCGLLLLVPQTAVGYAAALTGTLVFGEALIALWLRRQVTVHSPWTEEPCQKR